MDIDPLRDFKSRHGINMTLLLAPMVAAMGSARVNTQMDKMNEMGLSHHNKDNNKTANGK